MESQLPERVATPALPGAPRPWATDEITSTSEGGLDWRRVAQVVTRFKWLVLGITLAGGAAGFAATRVMKPMYVTQVTVFIDQPDPRGNDRGGPIRSGQVLDPQSWIDLLRSYAVLDHVARDQRLYLQVPKGPDPALRTLNVADQYRPGDYRLTTDAARGYVLAKLDGGVLDRGTLGDSIGRSLGLLWAPTADSLPPNHSVEFRLQTAREAALYLNDALDAHMDYNGNFLKIELRGAYPVRIAAILNAVAERYVEVAGELKRSRLTELTGIIGDQVRTAAENLRRAEGDLEGFRRRTITLPPDAVGVEGESSRDPVLGDFFEQQVERQQVARDREALTRVLAQPSDSGLAAALEVIGAVQHASELKDALQELTTKQAELRSLRNHYTEAYPPLVRKAAEVATLEQQTIPTLVRSLIDVLGTRQAELDRRIGSASETLRRIPARAVEEARLRRSVSIADNLYTNLQQNYEGARLAEASSIPDIRIFDRAVVPLQPVKNTAPRMLLLGFLGGLGLAVAGVVLLDRFDPRVRYPEQVSQDLGLPILGAVPHLKSRTGRQLTREQRVQLVEAMRGVCLGLSYTYGAAGPVVVTLSSPGPGDGKSFITSNLAVTFADAGRRTLLVDGDLRRGTQHRLLGADRRPGLTDVLRGDVPLEAALRATSYDGLTLIPCGVRTSDAPELLGARKMTELLARLRGDYDVILVDSPPLGAGIDPFVLSTLTGNLLLVLRTGVSHREVMAAKLEVSRRLPVRLLGAVLNDVPPGAAYQYYSYYTPGYEAEDEGPAQLAPTVG